MVLLVRGTVVLFGGMVVLFGGMVLLFGGYGSFIWGVCFDLFGGMVVLFRGMASIWGYGSTIPPNRSYYIPPNKTTIPPK